MKQWVRTGALRPKHHKLWIMNHMNHVLYYRVFWSHTIILCEQQSNVIKKWSWIFSLNQLTMCFTVFWSHMIILCEQQSNIIHSSPRERYWFENSTESVSWTQEPDQSDSRTNYSVHFVFVNWINRFSEKIQLKFLGHIAIVYGLSQTERALK